MALHCLPTKPHFSTGFARRHLLGVAVGLIVFLAASVTASERDAAALFPSPNRFEAGGGPDSVAVADFDGDGSLDVVTANWNDDTVSVLLGNGDGSFQPAAAFAVGSTPAVVSVADLNRDSVPDLITANIGSNDVSVILGNGDGSFTAAISVAAGARPISVAAVDLDGDSIPDLISTNAGASFPEAGDVSVRLGNGDGSFRTVTSFAVGLFPASIAATDLNGDGVPDLVTANEESLDVSVLLGHGDGTFQAAASFVTGGGTGSVAVADLDGDGVPDLATTGATRGYVNVLLGNGDGSFQAGVSFAVGTQYAPYPNSITAADFDGDSIPDLVTANWGSGDVSVLLGNGDGSFQPAASFVTGGSSQAVAVADLNGDSVVDLVTANFNSDDVSVLLGSGDGRFQAGIAFEAGNGANSVAVADLNGDGVRDLVTTNINDVSVSVLLGKGDGTYQPPARFLSSYRGDRDAGPVSVLIADLDRDAILDLAVANSGRHWVGVLLGNGDGTFRTATLFEVGDAPRSIVAADLDGDGALDLVTANSGRTDSDFFDVSVLLGNGDGSFQAATSFEVGDGPRSVAVADLNGDDFLDLVTANGGDFYASGVRSVSVLLGNGDGSFQAATSFSMIDRPVSVAVADLNGDGALDLVTANAGDYESPNVGSVNVLLGNGDGTFQSAVSFAAGIGANCVSVADLDGDGVLDIATAHAGGSSRDFGNVSVLLGNGDGSFRTATAFAAGEHPNFVAVADLSGDSLPDLVTANYGSDNITILVNQGEPAMRIEIDIKPGSDSNPVNPSARGNIPVAILGSDVFDVTNLDVTKLAFGAGAAAPSHDLSKPGVLEGHLEDVNGDGFTDLVSHYSISDSGILPGDTAACLTGKTLGGASFNACDSIRVITGR